MSSEPLVELDGLRIHYRAPRRQKVHAVEDFSIALGPGETIGLVGESGCGKSTVARAMVGLRKPTAGRVLFRGRDIWKMSRRDRKQTVAREVGLVFQDPTSSLNPRLRVRDTLIDPLVIHNIGTPDERLARARELIELVGLSSRALELRPNQLSGGQRQRVAIARSLALQPAVLIADEPTSALDVSIQNQILNLLLELRERLKLSTVFVSHNIQAVSYVADRVAVMYLGRLIETGPTDSVRRSPMHPYTAALLSASPMITSESQRIVLEGTVPSAQRPPSGCPFRTRCWKARDICAGGFPAAHGSDGHTAHCFFPEERRALASLGEATR